MAAEQLADVRRNEQFWRTTLGGQQYEDLERFARQRMQEPFFGRGGLRPSDIAMLFNLGGRGSSFDGSRIWDQTSTSEPSKKCPRPRQRAAHLPAAARPRHPEAAFPLRLHHWACPTGAPPESTRIGVTRYEAWRLPLAPEGSQGFVCLAIVTDMTGLGGAMSAVEDLTDKWAESLT
jgi:hypothetical protein